MSKRYFTVAEANDQVPALEDLFRRIMQIRAQLKQLYERLERAGCPPLRDQVELPPGAPPELVRLRGHFQALVESLRDQLESIHELGCVIKDVEVGLVDWLARNGDRDVLLCWRYGEPEVGFFHDLETGFAGRRPVSELAAPAPNRPRLLH